MMLAEPMSSTALPDTQAASAELAKANAAHEAGRLDEAQAAYLAALQANPYSPEAEHGLAWLAVQRGDWRSALPRFKRAITLRPWEPEFWISQIEALFQLGQDEAVHRMLHRAGQSGDVGIQTDAQHRTGVTPPAVQFPEETHSSIVMAAVGHSSEASRALASRSPVGSSTRM